MGPEVILSMDELNLDQAPQDINKEFQLEPAHLQAFVQIQQQTQDYLVGYFLVSTTTFQRLGMGLISFCNFCIDFPDRFLCDYCFFFTFCVAAVAEWYRYRTVACFVTGLNPVPLKTHRVEQRCTLNLSRAETSSRWCGVVVRRGGASSGVVHVT
ncbi:uncharacterized protein TNCV_3498101 [Trichonephila clavipes]|nr:uncharacterized protein TNCV_3498101 [Trichonephila clavipes]